MKKTSRRHRRYTSTMPPRINRKFNAILATSSINNVEYYQLFKEIQKGEQAEKNADDVKQTSRRA